MTSYRQMTHLRASVFALATGFILLSAGPSLAAEDSRTLKSPGFSFQGPFGTFDRGELQRGFQVYQELLTAETQWMGYKRTTIRSCH